MYVGEKNGTALQKVSLSKKWDNLWLIQEFSLIVYSYILKMQENRRFGITWWIDILRPDYESVGTIMVKFNYFKN